MHHSKYSSSNFTPLHSISPNIFFQVTRKPNEDSWDSPLPSGRIMELKLVWCVWFLGPHTEAQYSEPTLYFQRQHHQFMLLTRPSHALLFAGVQGALLLGTALAAGQKQKTNPNNKPAILLQILFVH